MRAPEDHGLRGVPSAEELLTGLIARIDTLTAERDGLAAALVEACGGDAPAAMRPLFEDLARRLEAHSGVWLRPDVSDDRRTMAGHHLAGACRDAARLLRAMAGAAPI